MISFVLLWIDCKYMITKLCELNGIDVIGIYDHDNNHKCEKYLDYHQYYCALLSMWFLLLPELLHHELSPHILNYCLWMVLVWTLIPSELSLPRGCAHDWALQTVRVVFELFGASWPTVPIVHFLRYVALFYFEWVRVLAAGDFFFTSYLQKKRPIGS